MWDDAGVILLRRAAVELSVVIQPNPGNGFRASCGEPLPATADGATREEALARLRAVLEDRVRGGVEVVRLHLGLRPVPTAPVWPDDSVTADWLAGIAAARQVANATPDPWDDTNGTAQP
jgi:hypothetical protein